MPEAEVGRDPWLAGRGKSLWKRMVEGGSSAIDHIQHINYTPPYKVTNVHWEMTFRALGWDRKTVEKFWAVFCRVNKSLDGEITITEFLHYFELERTPYVEKCFSYFDTTGGNSIDFLEFMVSVWNMCTMKIDALTNFAFDIFDVDSDGELSFPEIENMVAELYGEEGKEGSIGKEVLYDVTLFAEERGGGLDVTSFTIFTMNHSLLLFPVFQIQRSIQQKVMGTRYWQQVERKRPYKNNVTSGKDNHVFDPRHVQILLRTYKTGGAAAVLTHTGDGNQGLRDWFEKYNNELPFIQQNGAEEEMRSADKSKWQIVKGSVTKNGEVIKGAAQKLRQRVENTNIRKRDDEYQTPLLKTAVNAFLDAGKRTKEGDADRANIGISDVAKRLRSPKIQVRKKGTVTPVRERLNE